MHRFLYFAIIFEVVRAVPFGLISKRPLEDQQWTRSKRDGCPAYLEEGQFEFPHYITRVSRSEPDRAFGPQYNGLFTPNDISSIFSFDVPASRADANCALEFFFPRQNQLNTSAFMYEGGGTFFFTGYEAGSCPGPETTFNNQPKVGPHPPFPPIHMEPGYAYTIDVGPCFVAAGNCVGGIISTNDTTFEFFQDTDDLEVTGCNNLSSIADLNTIAHVNLYKNTFTELDLAALRIMDHIRIADKPNLERLTLPDPRPGREVELPPTSADAPQWTNVEIVDNPQLDTNNVKYRDRSNFWSWGTGNLSYFILAGGNFHSNFL
ncbi:hypothetical protein AAE478_010040 [Parahypoxylon ruwenzoriense]